MKPTNFVIEFGQRVRAARETMGISQEALAVRAGLHRTEITHIERATRSSTLNTIEKLATALEIHPRDLIPELQSDSPKKRRPTTS